MVVDVSCCTWDLEKMLWKSHVCVIVFSHGLSAGQLWWYLTHRWLSFLLNVFITVEQLWQQDFAVVAKHSMEHWDILGSAFQQGACLNA